MWEVWNIALYGGVIVNPTCFAKERKRAASATAVRLGPMSRHHTVTPPTAVKIRSDFIDGDHHSLHECGSEKAVHEDTPPRRMMGMMD